MPHVDTILREASTILSAAQKHATELSDLGVTEKEIHRLRTLIEGQRKCRFGAARPSGDQGFDSFHCGAEIRHRQFNIERISDGILSCCRLWPARTMHQQRKK
jgi:hypothetical protein